MKLTIALITLALATSAHAATCGCKSGTSGGQTAYGHNGAVGHAPSSSGSGQAGQGGSYFSPAMDGDAVDPYQPWPQSEMRHFQKK